MTQPHFAPTPTNALLPNLRFLDVREAAPPLPQPGRASLPPELTLQELLSLELPEEQYVVRNLLPVGLTLLAGKPKLGKSWLALQLALSLTQGDLFLGEEVDSGDVLYLGLEDSYSRLAKRVNLLIPREQRHELTFRTGIEGNYEDRIAVVREWLLAHPGAKAIIIDVWGRFGPEINGKDEYGQITKALQPLQALAHEFGVSVLLVHHAKKGESEGGDPFDQVLGSTALTSNADATLVLSRTRNQTQGVLHLTGRDVEERTINLVRNGVRWEVTNGVSQPPLPAAQQEVVDAIQTGHHTATAIAAYLGKSRTAIQNILSELLRSGGVEQAAKGAPYYLPGQAQVAHTGDMTDNPDVGSPTQVTAEEDDMTDKSDIPSQARLMDLI